MSQLVTLSDGEVLDVSAWPLPEGIEDGVLNRTQLARAFNVTENTITKWMAQGMPALSEGQNGVAYEFQLSHCHAWRQARDEKARALKLRGDQVAAQAALAFRNLDADQEEAEGWMSADELRKLSEAEYHRNRVAEQRGDLVRADRTRAVIEDVIVMVATSLETLPDYLEMKFGLSTEQVAEVVIRTDQLRDELKGKIEALLRRPASVVAIGSAQGEMAL
ncbi:terminase small subunit [Paracoccus sp. MBLB3053]|uniref:Terminase small subunit n=1 Tax=Paracoccus aurantius TaxID=3073814 RepID=A0ABU2HU87_9RHOB|nr:terminase small subunit [Paracoccus sp. MBLB3053]MDS9468614.1 terminase small subunit [Paracoccus sp. MBLB3053]